MKIKESKVFEVFYDQKNKKRIFTKALFPTQVYGEQLVKQGNDIFREWNAYRSKLAAAIIRGSPNIGLRKNSSVLYLGASTGTTVSHVSDIVGENGIVYALDISPFVLRDLVFLAEERKNIAPIVADANNTDSFKHRVMKVDVLYQDIAQRNQLEIFLKNADLFLKDSGYGILCIKARSIDITKKPKQIFKQVMEKLGKKMKIIDYRELDPYEKDHCIFICRKSR